MIFLSVLILSIKGREGSLTSLLAHLCKQINANKLSRVVEILVDYDNREKTIADKRNGLVSRAKGKFVVFIDDDDNVIDDYLKTITTIIRKIDVDYIGYMVQLTWDGNGRKPTYHSLAIPYVFDDDNGYYRNISHINPIRASIAKQYLFPEVGFGEDTDWNKQIKESGLVKREYYLNEVMYFYNYNSLTTMANSLTQNENAVRQISDYIVDFDRSLVHFVNKLL